MADEVFDYIGKIKILLKINDDSQDDLLSLYVDVAKQEVLNYCNISEIPSELDYVLCQIVVDCYREDKAKNGGDSDTVGNISSISEGGRSVSFGTLSVGDMKIAIEDRLTRLTQLNRFKKMYRL